MLSDRAKLKPTGESRANETCDPRDVPAVSFLSLLENASARENPGCSRSDFHLPRQADLHLLGACFMTDDDWFCARWLSEQLTCPLFAYSAD